MAIDTPAGREGADTVEGTVLDLLYESGDRAYGVARLRDAATGRTIVAVGPLQGLRGGERVRLRGAWSRHPRFGERFSASAIDVSPPSSEEGLRKYLASGVVPGIGKELADRIVRRFGDKTLEIIDSDPERLREIEGIGRKRLATLVERLRAERSGRDAAIFLRSLGLNAGQAARARELYGEHLVETVRSDPYRLAAEIDGIGFRTADRLALSLGFAPDAPERLEASVVHVLAEAAEKDGHVYLPIEEAIAKVKALVGADARAIEDAIERKRLQGAVAVEGVAPDRRVLAEFLRAAEAEVAARLLLLARTARPAFPRIRAEEAIRWAEAEGPPYSPGQRAALRAALGRKLCVVTGGPGVGKTTVLRGLLRILVAKGVRVALGAPTGRAAKRLSEATGAQAQTLHRLFGFNPRTGLFAHGPGDPLAADVVIVDEASMIDVLLARDSLRGLHPETTLVLVGDVDQLPSVGPGQVLKDLIESGVAAVATLSEVFRQAGSSRIVESAHRIRRGILPDLSPRGGGGSISDFHFVEKEDPSEARRAILELACERIPRRFGLDGTRDVQVLSPMRRGECGAEALNRALEERLAPGAEEVGPAAARFRLGAKVMQTRNDYDLELWNGDVGIVVAGDSGSLTVDFDGRRLRVPAASAENLVLAYAITVHKSQGSEYPAVIVPVLEEHWILLQRNLVYTAVTRGKKLVVVVGSRAAFAVAVRNASVRSRRTSLVDRLRGT